MNTYGIKTAAEWQRDLDNYIRDHGFDEDFNCITFIRKNLSTYTDTAHLTDEHVAELYHNLCAA